MNQNWNQSRFSKRFLVSQNSLYQIQQYGQILNRWLRDWDWIISYWVIFNPSRHNVTIKHWLIFFGTDRNQTSNHFLMKQNCIIVNSVNPSSNPYHVGFSTIVRSPNCCLKNPNQAWTFHPTSVLERNQLSRITSSYWYFSSVGALAPTHTQCFRIFINNKNHPDLV